MEASYLENVFVSPSTLRRRRGVVLSAQGWQRLQGAELSAAMQENLGQPFTLEQLSDRLGLSTKTLTKVRQRQRPVDVSTLQVYFQALNLSLEADDYIHEPMFGRSVNDSLPQAWLTGPLAADSLFYVFRSPVENFLFREINQPGALIRIKAPKQFGKTSLAAKGMSYADEQEFRTLCLSLQLADSQVVGDLDRFLRWFCGMLSRGLGLPNRLEDYWNPLFGSSYSCDDYFENYLLAASEQPLFLVLDDVHALFKHPEIAIDFFALLRVWHERSRQTTATHQSWQKLRLVLLYSTEVFISLNVHQSPFNVGSIIELLEFNVKQIQELTLRYGVVDAEDCALRLFSLLGGHPFLTQLALFHLAHGHLSLANLEQTAIAPDGIFRSHFSQQLSYLSEHLELQEAMKHVVQSPQGAELYPTIAHQLRGAGLIRFHDQVAVASCELYQRFFAKIFS